MLVRKGTDICASLLVLLFVYAGLTKLMDYQAFRLQLSKSPFITEFAATIAVGLPIVEIGVVMLLLFKRTRMLGFYISFFLMVLFTGYITAMLKLSYYIPCSCGGVLSLLSWKQHLIFNVIFIVVAIIGIVLQEKTNLKDSIAMP